MMKKFSLGGIYLACFLGLASCTRPEPKRQIAAKRANLKRHSLGPGVSRDALERYRQMRRKNWASYTSKRPRRRYYQSGLRPKAQNLENAPPLSPEQQKVLKIQTEQYALYFCMKHRKNKHFAKQNSCQQYTQRVISHCTTRTEGQYGHFTPHCVKNALRSFHP